MSLVDAPLTGNRRRRSATWLVPLAALALTLAACGSDAGAGSGAVTAPPTASGSDKLAPQPLAKPATMKVAFAKIEAYADILMADHYGEFKKENLTVEFDFLPSAESLLLVSQGRLDASGGATNGGLLNLIGKGADLRLVIPTQDVAPDQQGRGFFFNTSILNPDGGELQASDFVGKKVLTPSGDASPSAGYLYRYLQKLPGGSDLKPTDLAFEAMPDQASVAAAVEAGAAAAGKLDAPNNKRLLDNACCELMADVLPSEGGAYVFGRSMHERADVGAAFIRALARTRLTHLTGNYRDNAETNAAIAKALDVDAAALKSLPPVYYDPELDFDEDVNLALQEFYRARGLLQYEGDLTSDQVYDKRYLQAIGFGA